MTPQDAAQAMIDNQLRPRGIADPRVLNAMLNIPRHRFVPNLDIEQAYSDHALPTVHNQTISQPYIVARMTELLDVQPHHNVLEIGTGSGYQAAILATLANHLITIERHADLADHARRVLNNLLPHASIDIVLGDGSEGFPARAPYDRILVAAAAPALPEPLGDQLAPQGRIVIPLGDPHQQQLTVIDHDNHHFTHTPDIPCRFVPLVGEHAWKHGE